MNDATIYPLPRIRPKPVKPTLAAPEHVKRALAEAAVDMEDLARRIVGEHVGSRCAALDPEVAVPLMLGLLDEKPIRVAVILLGSGAVLQIEPMQDWPTNRD